MSAAVPTLRLALAGGRRLSFEQARRVAASVADALAERGEPHGALCPETILLGDVDDARPAEPAGAEAPPPYRAPELDGGAAGAAADVYALAVCFYEMVAGRVPFPDAQTGRDRGYAPLSRLAGLPRALDGILEKALSPDSSARYRSAGEFARALSAVQIPGWG